jgi:hypothetical protein
VLPHGVSQLLGGNASFAHGALALIGVSPSSMSWWRPMVIGPLARKTLTFTSPLDLAMKVLLSLGCFG